MKYLMIAIMYASFFGLIGFVCYVTSSALPLLALIFTPSYKDKKKGATK